MNAQSCLYGRGQPDLFEQTHTNTTSFGEHLAFPAFPAVKVLGCRKVETFSGGFW